MLKAWMKKEGRKSGWVAQQVGRSETWMSYILNRRKPMSDKLARDLQEKFGLPLLDAPNCSRLPLTPKRKGRHKGE